MSINFDSQIKNDHEESIEEKSIAKLSTLYNQGLKSDSRIDHSHLYNIVVTLLCLSSAISIGVIICYVLYVFY